MEASSVMMTAKNSQLNSTTWLTMIQLGYTAK